MSRPGTEIVTYDYDGTLASQYDVVGFTLGFSSEADSSSPGTHDFTWDVDFKAISAIGQKNGLSTERLEVLSSIPSRATFKVLVQKKLPPPVKTAEQDILPALFEQEIFNSNGHFADVIRAWESSGRLWEMVPELRPTKNNFGGTAPGSHPTAWTHIQMVADMIQAIYLGDYTAFRNGGWGQTSEEFRIWEEISEENFLWLHQLAQSVAARLPRGVYDLALLSIDHDAGKAIDSGSRHALLGVPTAKLFIDRIYRGVDETQRQQHLLHIQRHADLARWVTFGENIPSDLEGIDLGLMVILTAADTRAARPKGWLRDELINSWREKVSGVISGQEDFASLSQGWEMTRLERWARDMNGAPIEGRLGSLQKLFESAYGQDQGFRQFMAYATLIGFFTFNRLSPQSLYKLFLLFYRLQQKIGRNYFGLMKEVGPSVVETERFLSGLTVEQIKTAEVLQDVTGEASILGARFVLHPEGDVQWDNSANGAVRGREDVRNAFNKLRLEVGLHTVTASKGFAGLDVTALKNIALALMAQGFIPTVDVSDVLKAVRAENKDGVVGFFVNDLQEARNAMKDGASFVSAIKAWTAGDTQALRSEYPQAVIYVEVDAASDQLQQNLDMTVACAVDGITLKRLADVNKVLATANNPITAFRKNNPGMIIQVAGGVFQNKVAEVLAHEENFIAAVGFKPGTREEINRQAEEYIVNSTSSGRTNKLGHNGSLTADQVANLTPEASQYNLGKATKAREMLLEGYFNSGRQHLTYGSGWEPIVTELNDVFSLVEMVIISRSLILNMLEMVRDAYGIKWDDLIVETRALSTDSAKESLAKIPGSMARMNSHFKTISIDFYNRDAVLELVSRNGFIDTDLGQVNWKEYRRKVEDDIKGKVNPKARMFVGPEYLKATLFDKKDAVEKVLLSLPSGVVAAIGDSEMDVSFLGLKAPEMIDFRGYYVGNPADVNNMPGIRLTGHRHMEGTYEALKEIVENAQSGKEKLVAVIVDIDGVLAQVQGLIDPRLAVLLGRAMRLGARVILISGGLWGHGYEPRIVAPIIEQIKPVSKEQRKDPTRGHNGLLTAQQVAKIGEFFNNPANSKPVQVPELEIFWTDHGQSMLEQLRAFLGGKAPPVEWPVTLDRIEVISKEQRAELGIPEFGALILDIQNKRVLILTEETYQNGLTARIFAHEVIEYVLDHEGYVDAHQKAEEITSRIVGVEINQEKFKAVLVTPEGIKPALVTDLGAVLADKHLEDSTRTEIYTGENARRFLMGRTHFSIETQVIVLEGSTVEVIVEGERFVMDKVGAIGLGHDALAEVNVLEGEVVVLVTDVAPSWYERDFVDGGKNETGIVWSRGRVIVVNHAQRRCYYQAREGRNAPTDWITDATSLEFPGSMFPPIAGVSHVYYSFIGVSPFVKLRSKEQLHSHPSLGEKRLTEVYMVTQGRAVLVYFSQDAQGIWKHNFLFLQPGDGALIGADVIHGIFAVEGPYEHVCALLPTVHQYGFRFKRDVGINEVGMTDAGMQALLQEAMDMLTLTKGPQQPNNRGHNGSLTAEHVAKLVEYFGNSANSKPVQVPELEIFWTNHGQSMLEQLTAFLGVNAPPVALPLTIDRIEVIGKEQRAEFGLPDFGAIILDIQNERVLILTEETHKHGLTNRIFVHEVIEYVLVQAGRGDAHQRAEEITARLMKPSLVGEIISAVVTDEGFAEKKDAFDLHQDIARVLVDTQAADILTGRNDLWQDIRRTAAAISLETPGQMNFRVFETQVVKDGGLGTYLAGSGFGVKGIDHCHRARAV